MKYSPRWVILCAVARYLDNFALTKVMDQIGREFPKQDRKFLRILKEHFNFELMKDKPRMWQDIWIYNYLKYDYDNHKFRRSGLLAKYEREVILPLLASVSNFKTNKIKEKTSLNSFLNQIKKQTAIKAKRVPNLAVIEKMNNEISDEQLMRMARIIQYLRLLSRQKLPTSIQNSPTTIK